MTTFGIIAPAAAGHFNPMTVLAHQLQMRGHRAVFLLVSDWREKVEAEYPPGTWAGGIRFLQSKDSEALVGEAYMNYSKDSICNQRLSKFSFSGQ
jgi:uncharacterized protein YciU (UPF0263 family)